jgi:hypothetical protein
MVNNGHGESTSQQFLYRYILHISTIASAPINGQIFNRNNNNDTKITLVSMSTIQNRDDQCGNRVTWKKMPELCLRKEDNKNYLLVDELCSHQIKSGKLPSRNCSSC